jgi:hypothetical protein
MKTVSGLLRELRNFPGMHELSALQHDDRSHVRSTSAIKCEENKTLMPNSAVRLSNERQHLLSPSWVEPCRRLVEKHERRIVYERLTELDALLHARGVAADCAIALLEESSVAQRVGSARACR